MNKTKYSLGTTRPLLAATALAGILFLAATPSSAQQVVGDAFTGFGNNVPLSFAVKQIVPPNYGVFFGDGVDTSLKLSWTDGGDWPQILDRTLSSNGLAAEIVGDKVIITQRAQGNVSFTQSRGYASETETLRSPGLLVRPYTTVSSVDVVNPQPGYAAVAAPPPRPAPVAPASDPNYVDPFAPLEGGAPAYMQPHRSVPPVAPAAVEPVPQADDRYQQAYDIHEERRALHEPVAYEAPPEQKFYGDGYLRDAVSANNVSSHDDAYVGSHSGKEWVVTAGLTLQEILTDWTEEAGWSLVWDSLYEYPIEADAVFYGSFISHDANGGSLSGAAVDLIKSMAQARPPVNADFYVKNKVMVVTTSTDEHD